MSINWDDIKKEYIDSNGKAVLKELAEKHGVKIGTLRSRKSREDWDKEIDSVATCNATEKKKSKNVAMHKKATKVKKEVVKDIDKEIVEEVLENNELTDKQQLFCLYYIKYFNATKAYQKAYNCSYTTALVAGPRLLGNVRVKEQIEELKANRFQGAYLEADDILQMHIDIARADITDFIEFGSKKVYILNSDGSPKLDHNGEPIIEEFSYVNFKDSSEIDGTLVSEIRMGKDGPVLKLHDIRNSLNFLTAHKGLLSVLDQEKLKIAKERLELDKSKHDKGTGKDKPTEISIVKK